MSPVTALPVWGDVSENEAVETSVVVDDGVGGSEWEEDDPGNEPYGEENASDHAEEIDEEIGIKAVCLFDGGIVGLPYCPRPGDDTGGEVVCAFPG